MSAYPMKYSWQNLLTVAAVAFVVSWASRSFFGVAMAGVETLAPEGQYFPIGLLLLGQALVFIISGYFLLQREGARWQLESGCLWAGVLWLLTIPVLGVIAAMAMASDSSVDQGASVAAFFMLVIFGGAYLFFGGAVLFVWFLLRRARRNAA